MSDCRHWADIMHVFNSLVRDHQQQHEHKSLHSTPAGARSGPTAMLRYGIGAVNRVRLAACIFLFVAMVTSVCVHGNGCGGHRLAMAFHLVSSNDDDAA